jgi:hypothetical protein
MLSATSDPYHFQWCLDVVQIAVGRRRGRLPFPEFMPQAQIRLSSPDVAQITDH